MSNNANAPPTHSGLAMPALIGAAIGALFYFGLVFGLWPLIVPEKADPPWLLRVVSSWVNLFTLLAFGMAVSMLITQWFRLRREERGFGLLPTGDDLDTYLLPEDAQELKKKLNQLDQSQRSFVVIRLFTAALQRARATWSAQDTGEAVKTQAELLHGEQDTGYAMVRYLAWAIPSIGFIGTVLGIGNAMGYVKSLDKAVHYLHIAFDTTLVALVLSIVVMYLLHRVQAHGDSLIVRATDWCMQRFVYRMHGPKEKTT